MKRKFKKWVSSVEQDKLKALLKIIVHQTECDQLTSIDEIIQWMLPELQKIPSVHDALS